MDPKIVLEGAKGKNRVGKLAFFFLSFFIESGFLSVAVGCGPGWP